MLESKNVTKKVFFLNYITDIKPNRLVYVCLMNNLVFAGVCFLAPESNDFASWTDRHMCWLDI